MIVDMTTSENIKEEFKTLGIDITESMAQQRVKNTALKYMKPLFSEWHLE